MIIERRRRLPYAGRALVASGDTVSADTPVAAVTYFPGRLSRVFVSDYFLLAPAEAASSVVVAVGEEVAEGQLLAALSQHWDISTMLSPHSGNVEAISEYLGHVWIRERVDIVSQEVVIDLAKLIPLLNLPGSIRVSVGQRLQRGECIARGSTIHYVLAPGHGTVTSIDGYCVTLKPVFASPTLSAYVSGTVKEVLSDSTVVICGEAEYIKGVYGLGGEAVGLLAVLSSAGDVNSFHSGKIVAIKRPLLSGELESLAACGVCGIIAPSIDFPELCAYAGEKHVPGITGGEGIPSSVVLTEGFGNKEMSQAHQAKLQQHEGCVVSMQGTTHIRSGALRPEILLWRRD